MRLLTIGFTKKPAQRFVDLMRERRIEETLTPRCSTTAACSAAKTSPTNATAASLPSTFGSARATGDVEVVHLGEEG